MKNVAAGANPMLLKRGILTGSDAIAKTLADQAIELTTKAEIANVVVIRVGAATETELKEKKHRVEDALSATRAAVEEGALSKAASIAAMVLSTEALITDIPEPKKSALEMSDYDYDY